MRVPESGTLSVGDTDVVWDDDGVLRVAVGEEETEAEASELSMQLSRGREPRFLGAVWAWLGGRGHRDIVNLEVRHSRGVLVRLSAPSDDPARLEGLARLELEAESVALDDLLALRDWLQLHGVRTLEVRGDLEMVHEHPAQQPEEVLGERIPWRERLQPLTNRWHLVAPTPVITTAIAVPVLADLTPWAWTLFIGVVLAALGWTTWRRTPRRQSDDVLSLSWWGGALAASTLALSRIIDASGALVLILLPTGVVGCGILAALTYVVVSRLPGHDGPKKDGAMQMYGMGAITALGLAVPAGVYAGVGALLPTFPANTIVAKVVAMLVAIAIPAWLHRMVRRARPG